MIKKIVSYLSVFLLIVSIFAVLSGITAYAAKELYFEGDIKEISVSVNSSYRLKLYHDENNTDNDLISKCEITIDDKNIVEMPDSKHITGLSIGSTLIHITYEGVTKDYTVNVCEKNIGYIAHRGAMDLAPEDSIPAFEKAIDLHYKYIECDVFQGKDDNLFVCHSTEIADESGKTISIEELTLDTRDNYPITHGVNIEKYTANKKLLIPTLEEVLDVVKRSIDEYKNAPTDDGYKGVQTLYLHIKLRKFDSAHVARLENAIKTRGLTNRVVLIASKKAFLTPYSEIAKGYIYSTSWSLDNLKKEIDEIYNYNQNLKSTSPNEKGVTHIICQVDNLPNKELTDEELSEKRYVLPDELVRYAHSKNLYVLVHPLKSRQHMAKLAEKGINAAYCNKLLFDVDKSLTKCELAVSGLNVNGEMFKVINAQGDLIDTVTGEDIITINGKLSPSDSYKLIHISKDGTTELESSELFKINNTDEVQRIELSISVETTESIDNTEITPTESTEATQETTTCAPTTEPEETNSEPVVTQPTDVKTVTSVLTTNKKKANPITAKVKNRTFRAKKLKKKTQKLKNVFKVKSAQGSVTFKLVKSGITKKIRKLVKINSKGVITIKKWKKAKKGTYKIKVKITAKGNAKYNSKTITKTVKLKIK